MLVGRVDEANNEVELDDHDDARPPCEVTQLHCDVEGAREAKVATETVMEVSEDGAEAQSVSSDDLTVSEASSSGDVGDMIAAAPVTSDINDDVALDVAAQLPQALNPQFCPC